MSHPVKALELFLSLATNDSVIFSDSDKNKLSLCKIFFIRPGRVFRWRSSTRKSDRTDVLYLILPLAIIFMQKKPRIGDYLHFPPFHLAPPHTRCTQLLGLFVLYLIRLGNTKQIKYPCVWDIDWVTEWIPGAEVSVLCVLSRYSGLLPGPKTCTLAGSWKMSIDVSVDVDDPALHWTSVLSRFWPAFTPRQLGSTPVTLRE